VEALRYAVEHTCDATFVPYGVTLREAWLQPVKENQP